LCQNIPNRQLSVMLGNPDHLDIESSREACQRLIRGLECVMIMTHGGGKGGVARTLYLLLKDFQGWEKLLGICLNQNTVFGTLIGPLLPQQHHLVNGKMFKIFTVWLITHTTTFLARPPDFRPLVSILFYLGIAIAQDVHVTGYYRNYGTYVQPHYRNAPDGNFYNNWSLVYQWQRQSLHRKTNQKRCPLPYLTLYTNSTVVLFYDIVGDI
jgi:hypothetical protein